VIVPVFDTNPEHLKISLAASSLAFGILFGGHGPDAIPGGWPEFQDLIAKSKEPVEDPLRHV
jgi:hypothetical protein